MLHKHKNYETEWSSQVENRNMRYAAEMEPDSRRARKDLPIGATMRVRHIRSSTGHYCGVKQKVSILTSTEKRNQSLTQIEANA